MLSARWQKLWLVSALVLLFFPSIYILIEFPTEAGILKQWATRMLWQTQAEIPEYRELGVWYIRRQYEGSADRDLIRALESRFSVIDYSSTRNEFEQRLENLRRDQFLVIAEATVIYSGVIALLYAVFALVKRIFRSIGDFVARYAFNSLDDRTNAVERKGRTGS
jgi:hypothetical protein